MSIHDETEADTRAERKKPGVTRTWLSQARKPPAPPDFTHDMFDLVSISVRHCRMPHPAIVAALDGPVFPVIRGSIAQRGTTTELDGRPLLFDDNTTPRWALLWSHGYSMTWIAKGWTTAHVWARSKDPDAYTNVANLTLMPEALASLSDKSGPLVPYLQYHAFDAYGWLPEGAQEPEEPPNYCDLVWSYFDPHPDPHGFIAERMSTLKNRTVRALSELMAPRKRDAR